MTLTLSNITDFAAVIAMLVMTGVIMLVPKPEGKEWKPFRTSLNYLMVAFLVLGVANIPTAFSNDSDTNIQSAIVIGVAAFEALLFSAVTIVMLQPQSIFIRMIPLQITIISVLSIALVAASIYIPRYFIYALLLGAVAYVCMCALYTKVFWSVYKTTLNRLEAYYDEDMNNRIVWMRKMFFTALFIGLLAVVAALWIDFYPVFTAIAILFYVYILSCMLRYIITANYLLKAVEEEEVETKSTEETSTVTPDSREQALEKSLEQWVAEKKYLQTDIGVDEVARQLGTTYTCMSNYFSTFKGTTFRNWRIQLRIEEAKRIMAENQDISIKEVGLLAGFNDRANFYRYFQRQENMTPTEYREQIKD